MSVAEGKPATSPRTSELEKAVATETLRPPDPIACTSPQDVSNPPLPPMVELCAVS
jgi:hypothetical protein